MFDSSPMLSVALVLAMFPFLCHAYPARHLVVPTWQTGLPQIQKMVTITKASGRLLLFFLAANLSTAQRRGGGGGDGDGDGGDDGTGGDVDDDNDDTQPDSTPEPRCDMGPCACLMVPERERQYELPGLYYNGTLTVTHRLSDNSAWLYEDPDWSPRNQCQNNDRAVKTYEYPGLFFVGPTGNDSDTNPIVWILRGYQPAEGTEGVLDVWQRWVHLRSSDFVVPQGYAETDATRSHRETRVYWPTNITATGENTFSARAVYDELPILTALSNSRSDPDVDPSDDGPRTSQYITLSDVCYYYQTQPEGIGGPIPASFITEADDIELATTPTIWLPKGTTADIKGIGGSSVSFTLNSSLERITPYVSLKRDDCTINPAVTEQFEWKKFSHLNSLRNEDAVWNLTLTVSLSFRGETVRENSTRITGVNDGLPVFEKTYQRDDDDSTPGSNDENPDGDGGSDSAATVPMRGEAFVWLLLGFMGACILLGR